MEKFADLFLQGLSYEQWLRFYFMEDGDGDDARISVPEGSSALSRREEPEMSGMLDALDGADVSMENSRNALYAWLMRQTGTSGEEFASCIGEVSRDGRCRRSMDLLSGWAQALADGDAAVPGAETAPSFRQWSSAFKAWAGALDPAGQ